MSKRAFLLRVGLEVIFSLIFSFGILFYYQIPSFTILNHFPEFSIRSLIFCFISCLAVIFLIWILYSRLISRISGINYHIVLQQDILTYFPVVFLLLIPFTLNYYLISEDFLSRIKFFFILVIGSILYLKLIQFVDFFHQKGVSFKKIINKFYSLSLRKKLFILFAFSFLIYLSATGILISNGIHFSGDEPHYLLISHSLLKDKDINMANNYGEKDYLNYMPPKTRIRTHGRFGIKGTNYVYSIHLPGISVVVLPLYALGLIFKGKWLILILRGGIGIFGALLGLQLYLFFLEHWREEKKSILIWLIFSFTSPILFYSIHIYPEIIVALFSFYIFRTVYSKKPISDLKLILLGGLLSSFVWFGVKYNLIFSLIIIFSLYYLFKNHRIGWKIIYFLIFPFISYFLFFRFLYSMYGTFSFLSVYEGVISGEQVKAYYKMLFTDVPLSKRIETFLNYFLDQRDGLLFYSPVYLFSFLGVIELLRKKKGLALWLIFISLPYILSYAFLTQRGGYVPQARPLIPIFWAGGIFLGSFLMYNRKKFFSFLTYFCLFLSLSSVLFLLKDPRSLYQPTTHEITTRAGRLFLDFSSLHFSLPSYLPSFIKMDNSKYWPNYFWLAFILFFIVIYIFWKKKFLSRQGFLFHSLVVCLIVSFLFFLRVLYPRIILYDTQVWDYSNGQKIAFHSLRRDAKLSSSGRFYLHQEQKYRFIFTSRKKLEKIKFSFGSDIGQYQVKLSLFDLSLFENKIERENKEIIYRDVPFYKYKFFYLYLVDLKLDKLSDEPMGKYPFYFHLLPLRE
ncbi:MAG: hypothetical protein ACE5WD_09905 [Candidatus Aminicenantia bacterium]